MIILMTVIHILVCLFLIIAVLLQSSKGQGLAAALGGGGGSSSVLGGRSAASFLSKATTVLATVFMLSSLVQAVMVRTAETAPTTAIEREMQAGGAMPIGPAPFVESQALPGEEGTQEAVPAPAEPSGETTESPE